jgi:hypothetical protein
MSTPSPRIEVMAPDAPLLPTVLAGIVVLNLVPLALAAISAFVYSGLALVLSIVAVIPAGLTLSRFRHPGLPAAALMFALSILMSLTARETWVLSIAPRPLTSSPSVMQPVTMPVGATIDPSRAGINCRTPASGKTCSIAIPVLGPEGADGQRAPIALLRATANRACMRRGGTLATCASNLPTLGGDAVWCRVTPGERWVTTDAIDAVPLAERDRLPLLDREEQPASRHARWARVWLVAALVGNALSFAHLAYGRAKVRRLKEPPREDSPNA